MICPKCGKETKDDGIFCINCGANTREYAEQMQANNVTGGDNNSFNQTTVLNNNSVSLDKGTTDTNGFNTNNGFSTNNNFSANNGFNTNNNFSANNGFNTNNTNNNFNNTYSNQNFNAQPNMYAQPVSATNHTAEFDAADIADNKLFAMVAYMFGILGVVAAMYLGKNSAFVKFHAKQGLKLSITKYICGLAMIVSVIPFIGWLIAFGLGIFSLVLFIVDIIQLFDTAKGNANEAPIVSGFAFLK